MAAEAPLVICYHGVSSEWSNPTAVSTSAMTRQLALLHARGYVGFTFCDLISNLESGTLPKRAVAITFDDGYRSTLTAKPVLDSFDYPATVFVVTDYVDDGSLLHWPGIDEWHRTGHAEELRSLRWDELESLASAGWEIGSHTRSHPDLRHVTSDELEWEIAGSRKVIVERLGRCDTFAYPYGAATPEAIAMVSATGYRAACLGAPEANGSVFTISRTGLYGRDVGLRLRAKLSPRIYGLTRGLRQRPRHGAERVGTAPERSS